MNIDATSDATSVKLKGKSINVFVTVNPNDTSFHAKERAINDGKQLLFISIFFTIICP